MLKKLIVLDLRCWRRLVRRIDARILPAAVVFNLLSSIDKSNIVEGRTRGANPEGGSYREPGDGEGLPDE